MNDKMRDLSVRVMLLSARVISELPCLRCSSQLLSGDSFPVRDEPAISWLLKALGFFISSSLCQSGFMSGLVMPLLTYPQNRTQDARGTGRFLSCLCAHIISALSSNCCFQFPEPQFIHISQCDSDCCGQLDSMVSPSKEEHLIIVVVARLKCLSSFMHLFTVLLLFFY